jgi:hypothetical protein
VTCTHDRHRINAHAERETPDVNVTTEEAGAVIEHSLIAARAHRFPTRGFTEPSAYLMTPD